MLLESSSAEDLRYGASSFVADPSVTRSCHHFDQACSNGATPATCAFGFCRLESRP